MTRFSFALGTVLALTGIGVLAQPRLPRDRVAAIAASIRPFVDRLYAADPKTRAEAACEIGRRAAEATTAIPILLSMLHDAVVVGPLECDMSPWLRRHLNAKPESIHQFDTSPAKEAADALGDIGEPAVPGLLQALGETAPTIRRFAAYGLGEATLRTSHAAVVDGLVGRLRDDQSPEVRDMSAWALGEIEDVRPVQPLTQALRDVEERVRTRVAWALGEIEDPSAVDALTGALKDPVAGVRKQAAWALGEIEDAGAVAALSAALADADPEVRRQSAWALGEIEDATAVGALVNALGDTDVKVRRQAAWALGEIEDSEAVDGLTRALKDADWEVRNQAAWALGEIGDPRARDGLTLAMNDTNSQVRRSASHAIRQLRDWRDKKN